MQGKISRVLAAKTALSVRMDALGDAEGVTVGMTGRATVERRLAELEGKTVCALPSGSGAELVCIGDSSEWNWQEPCHAAGWSLLLRCAVS